MTSDTKDEEAVTFIVGTCRAMCPANEVKVRERQNRVHGFERVHGTCNTRGTRARPRAHRGKIVKEYSRPAAGKAEPRPEDIRPSDVLLRTTKFLLGEVCPRNDVSWTTVYEYVFDRMRAIRQDMVMQNVCDNNCVWILEKIVRFHLFASYRLCESPPDDFDPKINDTHIQECLKRLINMYESVPCHCNRQEMLTLYLLFNLGNTDALQYCLNFKLSQKLDTCLQNALNISLAWRKNNFSRVLKLSKSLPAIQLCAMHRHLITARKELLQRMCHGYNSINLTYPMSDLTHILALDNDTACKQFCENHGLTVNEKGVQFLKSSFKDDSQRKVQKLSWINEIVLDRAISLDEILSGEDCKCCEKNLVTW